MNIARREAFTSTSARVATNFSNRHVTLVDYRNNGCIINYRYPELGMLRYSMRSRDHLDNETKQTNVALVHSRIYF